MSNSEETSAATTHDQVKLVKVNPKDEALSADDSDSSTSHQGRRERGTMTPGPIDFRGPMGFRKAAVFSRPSIRPMSSRGGPSK